MTWVCDAMFIIVALAFVLVVWMVLQEIRND